MAIHFDRSTPSGAVEYFRHCISSGDLQGALGCFDETGVYMDRDGRTISGRDNIQKPMEHLCHWRPEIRGGERKVIEVGELVMWMDKYTLTGKQPDGTPVVMKGATACVMKRNKEGILLWLIDNPFAGTFFEA